jgi:hypothetical protein
MTKTDANIYMQTQRVKNNQGAHDEEEGEGDC